MVFIAQLDKRRQTERETEDGQERGDDTMLSHISDMISGGEDEDDQHNDSDPVCLLSRWSWGSLPDPSDIFQHSKFLN